MIRMKQSMSWLSKVYFLLILHEAGARSWREIPTFHDLLPRDEVVLAHLEYDPFKFTDQPTSAPINRQTKPPSAKQSDTSEPTARSRTDSPTKAPTGDPYPVNTPPFFPSTSYFNYDTRQSSRFGPGYPEFVYTDQGFLLEFQNNGWAKTKLASDSYWREFDDPGYGAWAGILAGRNFEENQCGNIGHQSPIDVRMSGVACLEHHQIRTRGGDHGVKGSSVEKQILSNKLRLVYERRPCQNIMDTVCAEPDPPTADFPNGWGGFADLMHVDFKIPAEHRINGEKFDGEMQIYHLHPGQRRLPTISSLIRVKEDGYNYYLQTMIDAFQHEFDLHRAQCADSVRRGRKLVSNFHSNVIADQQSLVTENVEDKIEDVISDEGAADYYETWGEYSTLLDDPEFIAEGERHRELTQSGVWHPHHEMLIPTYWFYGYDGSLTEPPCTEIVSWFVMDTPMVIGPSQLEQLKNLLFNHVDSNCRRTSEHYDESVARPIQDSAGRQVWRCTEENFPPDSERGD